MPNKSIPDGWFPISSIGKPIAGTKFLPFKVPLKDTVCNKLELAQRFSPKILMEEEPKLQLIIDLTNTKRYYDPNEFTSNGVEHCKISCPGRIIPPTYLMQRFFDVVDKFMKSAKDEEKYIGVHCTHGINRTGYFICNYMIERMAYTPKDAITAFQEARGHVIEREYLINELKNPTVKTKFTSAKVSNHHTSSSIPFRPPYPPQNIFLTHDEPFSIMAPPGLYPSGVNPPPGAIPLAQFPPPGAYPRNMITPDVGPPRYSSGRHPPRGGPSGWYPPRGGQPRHYPEREVSSRNRGNLTRNYDPDARQSQLDYYEEDSFVKKSYRYSYHKNNNNNRRTLKSHEDDSRIGSFSGTGAPKHRVAHKAKDSQERDASNEKDSRTEKNTHKGKHSPKGRAKKTKTESGRQS